MAIYMQIPGVKGNVTMKGYDGWIELHDFDFPGVLLPVKNIVGNQQNRAHTQPSFSALHVVKRTDNSSVKLFEHAHSATNIPKITVDFVTTGSSPTKYARYELTNALVGQYSERFLEGEDHPHERIRLNFEKMQKTFIPRTSKNTAGSPMVSGYDLSQATKM